MPQERRVASFRQTERRLAGAVGGRAATRGVELMKNNNATDAPCYGVANPKYGATAERMLLTSRTRDRARAELKPA